MFGFGKKEQKEDSKLTNPNFLALVTKWEAFLSKIDARFEESLQNAEEAILENLVESDYDIHATVIAWQGIKSQINKLSDKIEDTFDNTVKPQMAEYVESWNLIDQDQKGTILRESFYERISRFELILEGKLGEAFYNHAIKHLNKPMQCTQCSAKIEVKKDIFRSHYVSCDYCNTVNTFTPNDKIAKISWVVDNIAKYKSLEAWDASRLALNNYNDLPNRADDDELARAKSIEAFKIREDKERAFWTKFFEEKYKLSSENKDTFEHDLEVKMQFIYKERKQKYNF